jgi:cell wall assembly regulator SMI1
MTEADLTSVESALEVILPAYYRELMLNYPTDLIAASYGPKGEPGQPADDWLHWKPETIIRENQSARKHLCIPGAEGKAESWPTRWLVIGNDGGGDHWYIDLMASPGQAGLVWKFEHESGRRFMAAPSLASWAKHLRALFERFQRGEL